MGTKHTRGPWIYRATTDSQLVETKRGMLIAEVAQEETYDEAADLAEAEANARLIAAAPELLEALKDLVDTCDGNYRELTQECQKIIDRAEGK